MPRYRVVHRVSCEEWEVEAESSRIARKVVGWPDDVCQIARLERGPYAEITPPKVAVQLVAPIPGSIHICPDCQVTMVEKPGSDFWWVCPSCDLLYHEWDNKVFRSGEV